MLRFSAPSKSVELNKFSINFSVNCLKLSIVANFQQFHYASEVWKILQLAHFTLFETGPDFNFGQIKSNKTHYSCIF